jgi:hypothetical protein
MCTETSESTGKLTTALEPIGIVHRLTNNQFTVAVPKYHCLEANAKNTQSIRARSRS